MCFTRIDAMLQDVENELLDILRKGYTHDYDHWCSFDEFDHLIDLTARAHLQEVLRNTNGCCADSIVAIQDETERLRLWSERP